MGLGQSVTMAKAGDRSAEGLSFPQLVKWAEMVTRAEAEQALRNLPVSSSQMFVLVLIGQKGEATSADLARMMRITPQALTKLVAPLRDGGLISRRTDADHARRQLLRLTDAGRAVLDEAHRLSPAVEDALLPDFSPEERVTLKRLLARVARQFDKG
jgi:DNA-binding MarR family transcriptional regulator